MKFEVIEKNDLWQDSRWNSLPKTWSLLTVDDIKAPDKKSIISGPFGSNISSRFFVENGIPVIRGNNLSLNIGKKFIDEGFAYLTEDKANELNTWANKDDLVFTAVGTIGQVGIITGREKFEKYIISNKQVRLTVNNERVLPLFAYYWFASDFMVEQIVQRNTGSSVPLINLSVLKSLIIPVPPLPEQKAIAAVLSSLDDKIDLLHRQNHTLEAMAETLFRQWFVVEAQEYWEEKTLGDIISVKGGTTPSTKETEYWNGNIYWATPRDLSGHNAIFLFDTERKITEKGLSQIGSGLLSVGTVLLSSRAPIGYLAITQIPVAINQGYIAIVCDKVVSNFFIYLWCKANLEMIKNSGNGSVFQEISKSVFKEMAISLPPNDLLSKFDFAISPIFQKININQKQISTLETLRDTLLPKLMSGEIKMLYEEKT
jgi:type I restriction enzyme, S subunit